MIGQTLGRYCVIERIGRGGMGEVFLAEDTSLRRRVALKFLPPELQQDADARKRFIREARSAAALDHPYICHINEVADSDGRAFIVMEYVDGQTLRAKIAQGPVAVGDTLQVGIEVAEALEAAHGKGIVHRDIKPENIMLTPAGHAKVMDFGLAKQVGTSQDAETGAPTMTVLTSEGTMVGTPAYMSPEQLRGQAQLWTDTYDRELSGSLVLQSDIARRVAGALALELLPSEEARLAGARTVDPEAYEAVLKGTQQRQSLTRAGFDAAERSFNLALEKDPNYAAAWSGIAIIWASRLQLNFATREEGLLKAKEAVLKAIALDNTDPDAQRTLASILFNLDWDWVAAERAYARLFELDPGDATALPGYAHFLMIMGRQDEAMERIARALELDPYNITVQSFYAVILQNARRYDEAVAVAQKALSVDKGNLVATGALVKSLFMSGRYDELMARERQRTAKDPVMREAVEKGIAEAGYPGAVKRQVDIIAERYRKTGKDSSAWQLATGYARAKDKEGTLRWLEEAVEAHDNACAYLGVDPVLSLVHSEPRFQALARRVGVRIIK